MILSDRFTETLALDPHLNYNIYIFTPKLILRILYCAHTASADLGTPNSKTSPSCCMVIAFRRPVLRHSSEKASSFRSTEKTPQWFAMSVVADAKYNSATMTSPFSIDRNTRALKGSPRGRYRWCGSRRIRIERVRVSGSSYFLFSTNHSPRNVSPIVFVLVVVVVVVAADF